MKEKRLIGLSLLRIVACIGVLCVHLNQRIGIVGPLGELMNRGAIGPYVFYALSGYFAFASNELREGRVISYYKKRLLKILPVYYIAVLAQYFLYICNGTSGHYDHFTVFYWGLALTFLNRSSISLVPPSIIWSTDYFVWFYFMAPLLYKMLRNKRDTWICAAIMFVTSHTVEYFMPGSALSGFFHALFFFALGIAIYLNNSDRDFWVGGTVSTIVLAILIVVKPWNRLVTATMMYLLTGFLKRIDFSGLHKGIKSVLEQAEKLTYPIFLLHGIVLEAISGLGISGVLLFSVMFIFLTIAIAWVADAIVERILCLLQKKPMR